MAWRLRATAIISCEFWQSTHLRLTATHLENLVDAARTTREPGDTRGISDCRQHSRGEISKDARCTARLSQNRWHMVFSDRIAKRFAHRGIGPDDNIGDEEARYTKKIFYRNGNFFHKRKD